MNKIILIVLAMNVINIMGGHKKIIKLYHDSPIDSTQTFFSDSLFTDYISILEEFIEIKDTSKYYSLHEIQKVIKYLSEVTGIKSEAPRSGFLNGRYFVTQEDMKKWKKWYNLNVREIYSFPVDSLK